MAPDHDSIKTSFEHPAITHGHMSLKKLKSIILGLAVIKNSLISAFNRNPSMWIYNGLVLMMN